MDVLPNTIGASEAISLILVLPNDLLGIYVPFVDQTEARCATQKGIVTVRPLVPRK
jgi:hypothetical protein